MKFIRFFLILFTCNAFAQDNFVPGTVTTINGTVIKGELNYQDWKKTPEVVQFKKGEKVREYSPRELKSFEVESDKYISRKVTIDVTEQRLQKMDKSLDTKFEDKYIFLNVLAKGDVNLYEHYNIRPHYFAEKGDEFQELINRKYFVDNNSDLLTNRKYIGQLKVFLRDCNDITVSKTLSYKRKELTKLVAKYNACVSKGINEVIYTKKISKNKSHFYVTAGYFASNFALNGLRDFLEKFEGGSFSSPTAGIAYELVFSKNRSKWSLYNELTYSKYSYTENNNEPSNGLSSGIIRYTPLKINYSTINLNVMFRYKFHKENQKITPFANVGMGRSIAISMDNSVGKFNSFSTENKDVSFVTNSSYYMFSMGFGAIYENFSLELRYNSSSRLINKVNESLKLNNIGLMLSYKLK